MGWTAQGSDISLLRVLQTGTGAHPASYPVGTRVKRRRGEAGHSSRTSAKVKNVWINTSTPPYIIIIIIIIIYSHSVDPNLVTKTMDMEVIRNKKVIKYLNT
jgi:hypothetical protein